MFSLKSNFFFIIIASAVIMILLVTALVLSVVSAFSKGRVSNIYRYMANGIGVVAISSVFIAVYLVFAEYINDFVVNYRIHLLICLSSLFVIILLVNVVKYELGYVSKKKRRIVSNSSKRLADIDKVNAQYHFNWRIQEKNIIVFYVNSKAQFDRFDFIKSIKEKIKCDTSLFDSNLVTADYNRRLYVNYRTDLNYIHPLATESEVKKMRFSTYSRIEQMLCKEKIFSPVTSVQFIFLARYTSPQGRNSYEKSYVCIEEDIVRFKAQIEQEQNLKQTQTYQRKIMTDSLRYDILKRDGFRCVLCGRNADDGIKLQVDHIVPVSKGGKTTESNLRTLCNLCNAGKSNKYDPYGVN